MILPTLDLLAHNLVALLVAMVVVLLLSQLLVAGLLRAAGRVLRVSAFTNVTQEDREAFRKSLRRRTLIGVTFVGLALVVGAVIASVNGARATDLAGVALSHLRAYDFTSLKRHLWMAGGLVLVAILTDIITRALASAIGKGLSRWERLEEHKEALADVVQRLRVALRVSILCATAVLVAGLMEVTEGTQRTITIATYLVAAFYVSRFVTRIGQLLTEVFFIASSSLSKLESPLRHLGSLAHLKGVTKRVADYLVYVGTATWVAGQISPEAWYFNAGRIGLRIIIIFYMSRVLVEVCVLFIQDIFLGKAGDGKAVDHKAIVDIQRRKTLIPVIVGFLRYGIYFSALVMVLKEASIDPTPLLAGAGVIGVAIGFGAQTFVGDIVAGFFILFEDLILVGDLVEVSGVMGRVEEMGVRITKIRSDSGVLHSIPNGELRKVANHSRVYVNAVVDVYVPYNEDLGRVRSLLTSVAATTIEELTGAPTVVEVVVEELTEAAVLCRVTTRVPPGEDKDMGDALRARVVEALRVANVGAPRPRRAVLIDSALQVGKPAVAASAEEDIRPPEPWKPKTAEA